MTARQQKALYFPAWNAAAKACGWNKKHSASSASSAVNHSSNPLLNDLHQRICTIARERAQAAGLSGPSGQEFRHACHIVAFGRDKSSADLSNAELDRILALFRLLADPDDLGAMLAWQSPAEGQRKRLLHFIRHECVESYVAEVCRQKFGTDNWQGLDTADLRQLHMTLKNRPAARRAGGTRSIRVHGSQPSPDPEPAGAIADDNCPF